MSEQLWEVSVLGGLAPHFHPDPAEGVPVASVDGHWWWDGHAWTVLHGPTAPAPGTADALSAPSAASA